MVSWKSLRIARTRYGGVLLREDTLGIHADDMSVLGFLSRDQLECSCLNVVSISPPIFKANV